MNSNRFFVYGTLCSGNCRSSMWPRSPESIESAWVRGSLYDGPGYPAMRPGVEKIKGEVWTFRKEHITEVTSTLDRIEVTNQPGLRNLYDRLVVETFDWTGQPQGSAWVYQYAAEPEWHGFKRIKPDETTGVVYWSAGSNLDR